MKDKIIDYVLPKITTKKVIVGIIIIGITMMLLFPYVDANLFYSKRIQNRVIVLEKVTQLDMQKIKISPELNREYESILEEINKSDKNYINNLFNFSSSNTNKFGKFLSGGILLWILIPFVFFIKTKETKNTWEQILYKVLTAFILLVLGFFLGFIASSLPTVINKWFNYFGFPILLITIIILFAYKPNKKS